ncbi:maleylacetoacetate isomerase [Paracoccus sediminicola]|uniref:maleylacetoacetate isomerase n=1 Tax=Paracoccus sediminicola TaxID=3017783 RepID=UPI0022F0392D|nr:maleylacetoacetate isomerase [Paracoccus sediminicola]WBU56654.1 maleylacetoacetate isomerase [Paracoccus sediminicola]
MKFYGYFRSSAAYRCRIAFNLKGVQPEFVPVNLREGAQADEGFRRMNPQGLVPVLDTGAAKIAQSLAIIEWLDETHDGTALLPADPVARAHMRAFAQIIACDIHPLQNLRVLKYIKAHHGQEQQGVDGWCQHWIGEGLKACEAIASAQDHGGNFVFGEQPGLADIFLVPQMFSADRFGLDSAAFPRLNRIRAVCEALPEFAEAHPSRQPDAI